MKLKHYAMSLMLGMGMINVGTTAHAADDVSVFADIGAYSQYVWRGFAQSVNNDASVQGDVGVAMENGLSANVWFATGVDFGAGSDTEYDLTVDYSGESGDIGYSVGLIHYAYLDDTFTADELYVGASYSLASGTAYYDLDASNIFVDLSVGDTIADMFDASASLGYSMPDVGTSEVTYFAISASKDFDMGSYTLSPSLAYYAQQTTGGTNEIVAGVNASF